MIVLELFSGTKSFSKVAEIYGAETFTVDVSDQFQPDLTKDILDLEILDLPERFRNPDVVWASPPCQAFSVMTISKNWKQIDRSPFPISPKAELGLEMVRKTWELLDQLRPRYYYVENPRAMMRALKIMKGKRRLTITYCQYGETRMKPTDIWSNNMNWHPRPHCTYGDDCHESAPRGNKKTSTQGMSNPMERGIIPGELCDEIYEASLLPWLEDPQKKLSTGVWS